MLQVVLTGKAQIAYSTLSAEDSVDYEKVKKAVLKAYKLVPEAYRQRFRDLKKEANQTYMEFARQKERLFEDWYNSREITNFEGLKELMLIEEFKNCLPEELKTHLEEVQAESLEVAAKLSDEYALTHKNFNKFGYKKQSTPKHKWLQGSRAVYNGNEEGNTRFKRELLCYYCGKKGHVKINCLRWKQAHKDSVVKKALLIKTKGSTEQVQELNNSVIGSPKPVKELEDFKWYISTGSVSFPSLPNETRVIRVLRDTASAQSVLLREAVPSEVFINDEEVVLLGGYPDSLVACPLMTVNLDTPLVKGPVKVAISNTIPIEGVDFLLGNDLAKNKVGTDPLIVCRPGDEMEPLKCNVMDEICPVNVVTRSKSKVSNEEEFGIASLFNDECEVSGINKVENNECSLKEEEWSREAFIKEQKEDQEIAGLRKLSDRGGSLGEKYFLKDEVLMRRFTPINSSKDEVWKSMDQIVVPLKFRARILRKAHEDLFSAHLGIEKTFKRVSRNFFWPGFKKDVVRHCKTCHECQVTGKPNQIIPKAPLVPIPSVGEPFEHIIIDIVGPLPKSTSGVEYLFTIMDRVSRYPEAIPIKSIKSPSIIKHLVDYFSRFGLPKTIQSDQGSNFTSRYFNDKMKEFGIKHVVSTPYHPESQGAIERFHQTLKSMLKKYCMDQTSWAKNLPFILFAIRSSPNDSLGFSPFELVFGHHVRGPLELVRDQWEGETEETNILEWMSNSRGELFSAWEFAKKNLIEAQHKMKKTFDVKSKARTFKEGEEVLVLLPITGSQMQAKFSGPYVVERKINETNYVINMPDRKKKQLTCHINMLKPYLNRTIKPVLVTSTVKWEESLEKLDESAWPCTNSTVCKGLESKMSHLNREQKTELKEVITSFPLILRDSPGRTNLIYHDVDVEGAQPIKQHPYRLNPQKNELVKSEVRYMLKHKLIKPSYSPWSSPVVLVAKDQNQHRLCFDYRKVNHVTRTDTYPLPRVEDCIDRIGNAKYITKIDLMKGYWQVPLTERAKSISAFVTPEGLYECEVMPFGMKNAALTFQRLMNMITKGIKNCVVYIDDVIIFSETWSEHVEQLRELCMSLEKANLVINLAKSDFGHAKVVYLGHEVGFGKVSPKASNVQSILDFPVPKNRKNIMQFLGLAGYYRRFVANFSDIANPLSNLLKKNIPFVWDKDCEVSFNKLKSVMISYPVLKSPDFNVPFQLSVDASDIGVGAVLEQKDELGKIHPVAYFSKKLNIHQRKYSTIEKETLALILALSHFDIYISSNAGDIIIYSDHHPLKFLHKFQNKNQRLTRWSLLLQEYSLDIRHVKGSDNVVPDVLSRI